MVCDVRIEKLLRLLESENPAVRRNAAGSLRLNRERAVDALPALLAHLEDDDPEVREEVRRAVAALETLSDACFAV
jgi:HEAT repeat protein